MRSIIVASLLLSVVLWFAGRERRSPESRAAPAFAERCTPRLIAIGPHPFRHLKDARALGAAASLAASAGDRALAASQRLSLVFSARDLACDGTLTDLGVALAIEKMAFDGLRETLAAGELTHEQQADLAESLEQLAATQRDVSVMLARAADGDRRALIDAARQPGEDDAEYRWMIAASGQLSSSIRRAPVALGDSPLAVELTCLSAMGPGPTCRAFATLARHAGENRQALRALAADADRLASPRRQTGAIQPGG